MLSLLLAGIFAVSAAAEFTPFPAGSTEAIDFNFRSLQEEMDRLDAQLHGRPRADFARDRLGMNAPEGDTDGL